MARPRPRALFRALAPRPRLSEYDVFIDGLDARHDGVRIAHLTDIHVGRLTPREHVRHAVRIANRAQPDVVVLTGDYVCWKKSEISLIPDWLSGLTAKAVAVVLGNHDYFTSADDVSAAMAANGYRVLRNQHTSVDFDGAPLHLVGVDDPVTRHHDIEGAFSEVPEHGTRVVLCHCPERFDELVAHRARLVLSGHTHGAQIYIEGLTNRFWSKTRKRYRHGFFERDGAHLYVNPGVGFSGVRARIGPGTRSEVALLTLRRRALAQTG